MTRTTITALVALAVPSALAAQRMPPPTADDVLQMFDGGAALNRAGDDPFMEAAWQYHEGRVRNPNGPRPTDGIDGLYGSLWNIFHADPAPGGRGWEYLLALFEGSKPPCKEGDGPPGPPDCTEGPGSAWCAAGSLLHPSGLSAGRPWPGPNPDLWKRRCQGPGGPGGPRPWNSFLDWRR